MARAFTALLIAGCAIAAVACATTQKSYHICNDFDENMNCPDNTANVVVSM